ncbi:Uncharacterized protein YP598_2488 [Yersinia pseudotuberculosis]|uniref:Uncharacterized protein n=1 Tax=Yersinia pseudotuberculosis serotype O:1b (strain IP 31758) TaxID=349747 RepID=A0A0U1R2L3_YERP3|nr:hypothetical protein YpsIP31758_2418 [Yersinia pseudotuberculosis IP 31758]UFA62106.1 Uncharacterized protein YP598_2488 [Yersinia pseudotuberculosis]
MGLIAFYLESYPDLKPFSFTPMLTVIQKQQVKMPVYGYVWLSIALTHP